MPFNLNLSLKHLLVKHPLMCHTVTSCFKLLRITKSAEQSQGIWRMKQIKMTHNWLYPPVDYFI